MRVNVLTQLTQVYRDNYRKIIQPCKYDKDIHIVVTHEIFDKLLQRVTQLEKDYADILLSDTH